MQVLFVISELTFLGGAQKQLVELARELVRSGHAVTIYTLNRDVPRRAELAGSAVSLVVDQKRCKLDPAVLWRLNRLIKRERPDVVHSFLFDADIYARIAAAGTGVPVINSERNSGYSLAPLQKAAHAATRGLARAVVANSYTGKAFAEGLFRLPAEDIHVVWNGARVDDLERQAVSDTDFRSHFFGPGEHRIACLVGAIKPQKDYHLALETARCLIETDPRWRVLLVGDQLAPVEGYRGSRSSDTGSYKAEVVEHFERVRQKLARGRASEPERIRFAGARKDVPALVKQCDVLFVTSFHEGFPNAVLEAMALGVPVVSTEYSDILRILPVERQVVGSRSPEELAERIAWAEAHSEPIARRQRRWVEENATIERAAQALERVYRRYAGEGPLGAPAVLGVTKQPGGG